MRRRRFRMTELTFSLLMIAVTIAVNALIVWVFGWDAITCHFHWIGA